MVSTKNGTSPGVKSKSFKVIWQTMFITAMGFPDAASPKKAQVQKIRYLKAFYVSLVKVLPCKFCRDFCRELQRTMPLKFTSRRALMFSIYKWKDAVNKKLMKQERRGPKKGWKTKPSPPFAEVEKKYMRLIAKCSKTIGKCV